MDNLFSIWEKAKRIHSDSHLDQYNKDVELADLMTEMERRYEIPLLSNPAWEKKNPEVINVYRAISNMRKL